MRKLGEEGQSTIEFALTIVLVMGFVFFYVHLSLVFAFGSYVQYATFMSARAYLAAGKTKQDQEDRAKRVLARAVKQGENSAGQDRWPFLGQGEGGAPQGVKIGTAGEFDRYDPNSAWQEGVRYTFKTKLFFFGLGGGPALEDGLKLTSESWLGREPTHDECVDFLTNQTGGAIFDNGC